jgi:hypothetical protein
MDLNKAFLRRHISLLGLLPQASRSSVGIEHDEPLPGRTFLPSKQSTLLPDKGD